MTEQSVILVTGATGNIGRQVVSQLLGTGVAVRALTRNPDSAGLPGSVEMVHGRPGRSGHSGRVPGRGRCRVPGLAVSHRRRRARGPGGG